MWAYSLSTSTGTPSTIIDAELNVYDFNSSEKQKNSVYVTTLSKSCIKKFD